MSDVCQHGLLQRACPICERDERVNALEAELKAARQALLREGVRVGEIEAEKAKLKARCERLADIIEREAVGYEFNGNRGAARILRKYRDAALADKGKQNGGG